jgi:hypothetical protein
MNCSIPGRYWFHPLWGSGQKVKSSVSTYTGPFEMKTTEWLYARCEELTQVFVFNRFNQTIYERAKNLSKTRESSETLRGTSVIVALMDAVSRAHYLRTMPATDGFLLSLKDGDFEVFNFSNYHAVGFNSIQNKLPMMAGVPYRDFAPVTKTGTMASAQTNRTKCELFKDWIYDLYRENGYVSLHGGTHCGVEGNFPGNDPSGYFPKSRRVVDHFCE